MNQEQILEAAARAAQQQPQQPPPGIPAQPVPMSFKIGQTPMPDGNMGVVLMVSTPVGEAVYFLDSKMAGLVADGLKQASQASASGLVVPGQ